MRLFASWSGGKDCMLALYRIIKTGEHNVDYLINMCDVTNGGSLSHGLPKHLIAQQAANIGISIMQPECISNEYEDCFKYNILKLKEKGVSGGIFGDIYLEPHREWIERVCAEIDIKPFFPLWGNNTNDLLNEFVKTGFKALLVSVNRDHLPQSWLGKLIDNDFITRISEINGIDPCAENGEYHSFVYDGPIFKKAVPFSKDDEYFEDNHWFLKLN